MKTLNVYVDLNGRFYKAEESKDVSHARKPLVTADFLTVLPDDGTAMELLDINAAIENLRNAG